MRDSQKSAAWSADDAQVAAQSALTVFGVGGESLHLLRLGENAIFRIGDSDILLRVARPGTDTETVLRTIEAALLLRASGIPVGEPARLPHADEPLKFENGIVSAWRYYPQLNRASLNFREFGKMLRNLHLNAGSVKNILPTWDPLTVVYQRLISVEKINAPTGWIGSLKERADVLARHFNALVPILPVDVIHGDAHSGNVLVTNDGLIFVDLDNLAIGPREADFAPTIVQLRRFGLGLDKWRAMSFGYTDRDLSDLLHSPLVRLRELFMVVWLLQQYGISKEVDEELSRRISSLDDEPDALTRWNAR